MASTPLTYFEDVVLGEPRETPAITVTEAHIGLYRGLTGETGDPAAVPDLLPLCLSTGLGWRVARPPLAVLAFMSFDWHVVRPLTAGDTLRGRARTAVKRSLREGGVIIEEQELVDQRDDVVQRGRVMYLVAKRPPVASP
jgi:acyl dehydratase